jgi:hypothetical protein
MAYKCISCGHIFEDGEQGSYQEYMGEHFGFPAYDTFYCCPICKGDYEKTVPCEICGSEHLEDELSGGVCDDCIESAKNLKDCVSVGKYKKETIRLNGFFGEVFNQNEIEQILSEYISQMKCDDSKRLFEKYIDSDKEWFGEMLVKEVKSNENTKR